MCGLLYIKLEVSGGSGRDAQQAVRFVGQKLWPGLG